MHRLVRTMTAALTGAALVAALGAGAVAAHGRHDTSIVGHVYVNRTRPAGTRSPASTVTPTVRSPRCRARRSTRAAPAPARRSARRAGSRRPTDGRYLLATDPASDEISVLRILPDGSLQLADVAVLGRPRAGQHRRPRRPRLRGQHRRRRQQLHRLPPERRRPPAARSPGRPYALPDARCRATSSSARMAPASSRPASGPSAGPSFLDGFAIGPDGRLTAAPGSPFPAQRIGPFGSTFSPTNADQLFVSNAHDGAGAGSVSVYDVAANGALTRHRRLALCRQPDGAVLGRDQPRRPGPVRREHRRPAPISSYAVAGERPAQRSPAPRRSPDRRLGRPFDAAGLPRRRLPVRGRTPVGAISALLRRRHVAHRALRLADLDPAGGAPFGLVVD